MGRLQSAKQVVASAITGGVLLAGTLAYADAPAPKWYDTIGLSGYLQSSYVANFNTPHNTDGSKGMNGARQFDTDSNGFSFNTFLLQIAKPVGDTDHYGFTVRLRTGQDAQSLTGGSVLFVQEAYATYVVPSMTKLSIIGGKFVTPEGFEVVDTVNNPNFSEGLLFYAAEPITHTGIKATYTLSDKVNTTIGVVNGWDRLSADQGAPDINTGKTILWQVATTPTKQITWSFQGLYGKELADPSSSQRLSLDTVVGFNPSSKIMLAGQANWGQESNATPGVFPSTPGKSTNHWDGLGFWASYMTSSIFTESVRFEVLADQNGADRFGNVAPFNDGTTNETVKEFTLTHKTMLTSNLGTRLEFRHDWSNQGLFQKHDGTGVSNQNTISADWFVTF